MARSKGDSGAKTEAGKAKDEVMLIMTIPGSGDEVEVEMTRQEAAEAVQKMIPAASSIYIFFGEKA